VKGKSPDLSKVWTVWKGNQLHSLQWNITWFWGCHP